MLPNLIIIGAQKCGTTSLHYYLALHPQIFMSRRKELHFFIEDRGWRRGQAWYERHFPVEAPVRGETTPAYTNYPRLPGVPERMHAMIPDARLIFLVRDPIARIVSQYTHYRCVGWEQRSLAEAVANVEQSQYVARSRYAMQLERFLAHYPRERILILSQDDLLHRSDETLRETFRFLGVDETFTSPEFAVRWGSETWRRQVRRPARWLYNPRVWYWFRMLPPRPAYLLRYWLAYPFTTAVQRPEVTPELRARLVAALTDDAARFRALTGRDFADWSL